MSFIDLKFCFPECHSPASRLQEMATYELRENDLFSVNGLYTPIRIPSMRRTIQRQLQGYKLLMLESVSLHGICSTDLPGKPERHSGLSTGNPAQTLSHGHTRKSFPKYAGQCESGAGLANLRRFRSSPDQQGQETLCRRELRDRTGTNSIRPGFHHHRSVFVSFPLGHFSKEQGRYQASYPSGSEGQYSHCSHRYPRKNPRVQRPRSDCRRTRRYLYLRSWLSRFCTSAYGTTGSRILYHQGQEQLPVYQALFPERRQIQRGAMRSDRYPHKLLCQERLPVETQESSLLRFRSQQAPGVPDQQLYTLGKDHRRSLQMPMADRTVLQMDQTAPEDQGLLWHLGECRKDPNMDCYLRVCSGSYSQKRTETGPESLHNSTDFECDPFRENALITGTFKERLHKFKPCPRQPVESIRLTLGQ